MPPKKVLKTMVPRVEWVDSSEPDGFTYAIDFPTIKAEMHRRQRNFGNRPSSIRVVPVDIKLVEIIKSQRTGFLSTTREKHPLDYEVKRP